MNFLKSSLLLSFLALSTRAGANDEPFRFEFEGGLVWQTRNVARIPGDTGTEISLREFRTEAGATARFSLLWRLAENHELKLMLAPLSLSGTSSFSSPVNFQGTTFAANTQTDAVYKFHSYRLSYRYQFLAGDTWRIRGGLTGKIRNARIALKQGALEAEKLDVGFVPLLHLNVAYAFSPETRLEFEIDALAAPQGRAEDLSLFVWYEPKPCWEFGFGYRMLEGGADNASVYTFSWLHYMSALVAYRF